MLKIWEKHPSRIGMILGALAVPLGWWLQEVVVRLATFYQMPDSQDIRNYIVSGMFPGAILGIGISQAYFAFARGDRSEARADLLLHSLLVLGVIMLPSVLSIGLSTAQGGGFVKVGSGFSYNSWIGVLIRPLSDKNFAFQIALLMLFIGLLMRPRR